MWNRDDVVIQWEQSGFTKTENPVVFSAQQTVEEGGKVVIMNDAGKEQNPDNFVNRKEMSISSK